jgi:hypothetical protein
METWTALTCYGLDVPLGVAAGNEDNVALAGVGIVGVEKEELLDTIVSQRRGRDYCADGTS